MWKPIDTVVRDRPVILGYLNRDGRMGARGAFWMDDIHRRRGTRSCEPIIGAWVCTIDNILVDQRATHWMHMPSDYEDDVSRYIEQE